MKVSLAGMCSWKRLAYLYTTVQVRYLSSPARVPFGIFNAKRAEWPVRIPLLQFTTSAQTRKQTAGSLKRVSCFLFQPSAHRAFQIRFLPFFHLHSPSRAGRRASVLGSRQEAAESRCGNERRLSGNWHHQQ